MTFLEIDCASLNLPLERHLQTLSSFIYLFCLLLLGPVCTALCIYTLFFTRFYWLVPIYACYRYFDGKPEEKGGRAKKWVQGLSVWRYYRDYLSMKLIKTAELDPSKNYILALFPHGFMASGGNICFATEALSASKVFPGIRISFIALDVNFRIPGAREFFLARGDCSSSKKSLNYLLSDPEGGRAAALVVGGAAEALLSRPGNYRLKLKERMGFVKLALKNGASLVPVISFGENDLYDQWPNPEGSWLRSFQESFKKYTGFTLPIIIGRGFFQYTYGFLPRRRPVSVVVGKPIDVKKVPEPTDEQIMDLHQRFVFDLMNLFEDNKHKYLENAINISLIIE